MSQKNDPEVIHAVGVWALRVLLVAGAITLAALGKDETAGSLGLLVVLSFLWL